MKDLSYYTNLKPYKEKLWEEFRRDVFEHCFPSDWSEEMKKLVYDPIAERHPYEIIAVFTLVQEKVNFLNELLGLYKTPQVCWNCMEDIRLRSQDLAE